MYPEDLKEMMAFVGLGMAIICGCGIFQGLTKLEGVLGDSHTNESRKVDTRKVLDRISIMYLVMMLSSYITTDQGWVVTIANTGLMSFFLYVVRTLTVSKSISIQPAEENLPKVGTKVQAIYIVNETTPKKDYLDIYIMFKGNKFKAYLRSRDHNLHNYDFVVVTEVCKESYSITVVPLVKNRNGNIPI